MDCQDLVFSQEKGQQRYRRAEKVFGAKLLQRLVVFVLYVLGASRRSLAQWASMPEESAKTFLRVVLRDGFVALRDRRMAPAASPAPRSTASPTISMRREPEYCVINFGGHHNELRIRADHPVQARSVVLSLLNAGLIQTKEAADTLDLSPAHCRVLAAKLASADVPDSLVDQRKGQHVDFRVGPEVKAELIGHFAARVVTGHSCSSDALARMINQELQITVSARTVRWHVQRLGLRDLRQRLPQLIEAQKKRC